MEAKLLKIKVNPGSKTLFKQLLEYMKNHPEQPLSEMKQKGYFWDSVFYSEDNYLYMVLKSKDFSKIMMDESELIATPFRAVYEEFRESCWIQGAYQDIESLFCFNHSLSFMDTSMDADV